MANKSIKGSNLDLSSPEFVNNPYPTYELLQQKHPVYWCEEKQFYYISHYSHVQALFRHKGASSNRVKPMVDKLPAPVQKAVEPLVDSLSKWLLFQDPPSHTPLRKVINQSLANRVISDMAPEIQRIVDELINDFIDKEQCELIKDFAYPLPAMIISQLLGVPEEDRDKIKQWSDDIAEFLGDKTSLELVAKTQQSIVAMGDYFTFILQKHRQSPKQNLMSKLLDLQAEQAEFTDEHLVANCSALIFAGHETTTNLIANSWLALTNHPSQLKHLQDNLQDTEKALEECMRFESPVQRMGRFIQEPIEIEGHILQPGKRALLMIGAANRDPILTEHPNVFNIHRTPTRHLAFGHGIHLCSGAMLGRLESTIAIRTLVKRLNTPCLSNKFPEWQYNLGLRAMKKLPLTFSASH